MFDTIVVGKGLIGSVAGRRPNRPMKLGRWWPCWLQTVPDQTMT